MDDVLISCKIRRGLFPGQYSVTVSSKEGQEHLFHASRFIVSTDKEPNNGEEVSGKLQGTIKETKENAVLVQFPIFETDNNMVWISSDKIEAEKAQAQG